MAEKSSTQLLFASGVLSCLLFCLQTQNIWCITGEKRLAKSTRCPGQLILQAHRYQTFRARSVVECVVLCRPDDRCVSIVFDAEHMLCYLGDAVSLPNCSNMEDIGKQGVAFYEKVTTCAEGFRGTPCTPFYRDCTDVYARTNVTGFGIFSIHPLLAPEPFPVHCKKPYDIIRTYILKRRDLATSDDTALNFYRNFSEYQAGFGDLNYDFWLGLDKVHQLTNSKVYGLRIAVKDINETIFNLYYPNFTVSHASDGYRIDFEVPMDKSRIELDDCFTALNGAKFSAPDNDMDEDDSVNCAEKRQAGWWFRGENCSTCNPTGPPFASVGSQGMAVADAVAFWARDVGDVTINDIFMFLVVT